MQKDYFGFNEAVYGICTFLSESHSNNNDIKPKHNLVSQI